MNSALDVAAYVLSKRGAMSAMKLQKLVYYAQAWSLAWRSAPVFDDAVRAWQHGPAVPALWEVNRGKSRVDSVGGRPESLSAEDRAVVDEVLLYYGDKSAAELRNLSHDERPWRDARGGLPEEAQCNREIPHEAMRAFYAARPCGGGAPFPPEALSAFSPDRVARSREQLARGEFIGLDDL